MRFRSIFMEVSAQTGETVDPYLRGVTNVFVTGQGVQAHTLGLGGHGGALHDQLVGLLVQPGRLGVVPCL